MLLFIFTGWFGMVICPFEVFHKMFTDKREKWEVNKFKMGPIKTLLAYAFYLFLAWCFVDTINDTEIKKFIFMFIIAFYFMGWSLGTVYYICECSGHPVIKPRDKR